MSQHMFNKLIRNPSVQNWCMAVAFSIPLLLLIARAAVNVPFKDEYQFTQLFNSIAHGSFPGLKVLLAAHNGHPYLILKLLMAIALEAGLPWSILMYAQVPLLAVTFLILAKHVRSGQAVIRHATLAGLAMLVLTAHDWENLYWGMQIAFPLTLCTSVCAFHFASRYALAPSARTLLGSLALGIAAVLSSGAGIVGFAFMTLALAYLSARHRWTDFYLLTVGAAMGAGLFVISQLLSTVASIGHEQIPLLTALDHVVRLFADSLIDLSLTNPLAILLGVLLIFSSIWSGLKIFKRWPENLFEILLLLFGTCLILGITYARLKMGIYQPNASRYVVLVVPISIGCLLVFYRHTRRIALVLLLAVISIGYAKALTSEWHLTPYRNANLNAELVELCTQGKTADLVETAQSVRSIQHFFCSDRRLSSSLPIE